MVIVGFSAKFSIRIVAAMLLVATLGGAAAAQQPDNWLTRLFQPAPASPVPAAGDQVQWSGQSGASGNPLMTADAIRAAAAQFGSCIEAMWPDAARRGITRANFERLTARLTPDLSIMDKLDAQPEFTKAPWDYLDLLVSDDRIAQGRALAGAICADLRRRRTRLRRRPRHSRGDLGRRIGLRHARRRSAGDPLDRDACLRRPPPRFFPRGVFVDAGNPAARRRAAGPPGRFLGRRVRADAIHADDV